MQPKNDSADQSGSKPKQPALTTETAGQFAGMPSPAIDDGSEYGDPHTDDRPQFLKDDEAGWQPLFNWRMIFGRR